MDRPTAGFFLHIFPKKGYWSCDVDAKTLSPITGHVSSAATLNIYIHVTGEMQRENID